MQCGSTDLIPDLPHDLYMDDHYIDQHCKSLHVMYDIRSLIELANPVSCVVVK